jgi:hypothetical protein
MPHYRTIQDATRILKTTHEMFLNAVKATGLRGRVVRGTRVWTETELVRIGASVVTLQGMSQRKHHIDSDRDANPALAAELGTVRGSMCDAAEKFPIPNRFDVIPCEDSPRMIIRDKQTGREARVPLYAYGAIRAALSELFS